MCHCMEKKSTVPLPHSVLMHDCDSIFRLSSFVNESLVYPFHLFLIILSHVANHTSPNQSAEKAWTPGCCESDMKERALVTMSLPSCNTFLMPFFYHQILENNLTIIISGINGFVRAIKLNARNFSY